MRRREMFLTLILSTLGLVGAHRAIRIHNDIAEAKYISPKDYRYTLYSYDVERAQAVYWAYKWKTWEVFNNAGQGK